MSFRISGLPLAAFAPLFGLPEVELAARGIVRQTADLFGLFRRDGGGICCHSDLTRKINRRSGFMLASMLIVPLRNGDHRIFGNLIPVS